MSFKLYLKEVELYHGTKGSFEKLEPRKARFGTGISFTNNPEIAKNYALGKYKGGKTSGDPVVKKTEYSGNSFNLEEPVQMHISELVLKKLEYYLKEFTADKQKQFIKNCKGAWRENGKLFYKEIQRSFAKKGTDSECKYAKSRNANIEVCEPCSAFQEMPDLLNNVLLDIGYDALCYDDVNDNIKHRCYFLFKK